MWVDYAFYSYFIEISKYKIFRQDENLNRHIKQNQRRCAKRFQYKLIKTRMMWA
jgi:hypothetical protein